jgi:hypothetical protein
LKNSCSSQLGDSHERDLRRRIRRVHFRTATLGPIGMKRISQIPIDKEVTNSCAPRTVDDSNWAVRSGMWRNRLEKASTRRTKRAKVYPALILAGHGVSLRIRGGALEIKMGSRTFRNRERPICFFGVTRICPSELSYWTAAAAFLLMFYHGSPSRKSALFALIRKAILSASLVHRDLPLRFSSRGI